MQGTIKETLTIAKLERMKNSASGNPRFMVTFTNGTTASTSPDSAFAYEIENSQYRDVPLIVKFNGRGQIIGAENV